MHRDDKTRIGVRSLSLIALLAHGRALSPRAAGSPSPRPPGSPENPLVAQTPQDALTAGASTRPPRPRRARRPRAPSPRPTPSPGYQKLVERQTQQAAQPLHAVQPRDQGAGGRDRRGAAAGLRSRRRRARPASTARKDGKRFVTLAVQSVRALEAQAPDAQAPAGGRLQQDRLLRHARTADALRAALGQPRAQRRGAVPGGAQVRGSRRAPAQRLKRVRGVRVYQVSNSTALLRAHRRLLVRERTGGAAVPRTVFLLGLTSLFTDISSEMVVTILPLYLVYVGGFTPLAFGVIDGIYNGAAALVGLGQRLRRRPLPAPQGGRDGRLRPLGRVQAPAGRRRHGAVGHRRDGAHRPHRQGHPHGPARRDDLAVHARAPARRRLRRAPRAGHDRGDDRPAAGLRPAGRSRRWPSTRSSSSASSSRSSAWASSSCSSSPSRRATPRSAPSQPAPSLRAAVALLAPPALPRAPDRRRRAEPGHGQRRLRLPRPAGQARPRQLALPAALRGQRDHLHGARGADGQARRPLRPRPRVPRRLRAAASRSTPRCCRR